MNLNLNNVTFIIVSFKSEKVIYDCLDSLPNSSNKIIIDNSKDIDLKKDLEIKYDNIEVILNENLGMGASNNIGIKRSKTQFVYILNPDITFESNSFSKLVDSVKKLNDFAIISPMNSDLNFPNYKKNSKKDIFDEDIIEVDTIDGFSMLINKEKFKNNNFFDENFFLYLENDDLCLRMKKSNEKLFIIKNSLINHLGASSSSNHQLKEIEYLRNWHWMWSKFYYNKKHYGFINAFFKIFNNLLSASIKFIYYLITLNPHKKKIYKMRISGLVNSIIGKKSYYRINY